jgi:phosphatidylserine/phosphatidylglycerophosphate/cardiolipin synthase-like enzyme
MNTPQSGSRPQSSKADTSELDAIEVEIVIPNGNSVTGPLDPEARAAIAALIESEVRRKLDLLYWKYKENNHQSVDMTFVDAYNAVIAELEAGSGEAV